MSEKPLFTITAFATGIVIGFPLGSFFAANLLPIDVGDGWANIGGAALGVFGAFYVANWSFHRAQKARERQQMKPFVERLEYCVRYVREATKNAQKVQTTAVEIYTPLLNLLGEKDSWHTFINKVGVQDSAYPRIGEVWQSIAAIGNQFDIKSLATSRLRIDKAISELKWIVENMKTTLSPMQIEIAENAIKRASKSREIINSTGILMTKCQLIGQSDQEFIFHDQIHNSLGDSYQTAVLNLKETERLLISLENMS